MSTNRVTTGADPASGFQAAPTGTHARSSGARSRKITSFAGIFCSGSLTTAMPNPAATKESAVAAPSASLTQHTKPHWSPKVDPSLLLRSVAFRLHVLEASIDLLELGRRIRC